jgi:hypothetical protein
MEAAPHAGLNFAMSDLHKTWSLMCACWLPRKGHNACCLLHTLSLVELLSTPAYADLPNAIAVLCSLDNCQQYASMHFDNPPRPNWRATVARGLGDGVQQVRLLRQLKSHDGKRSVQTPAGGTCCWPCNSVHPQNTSHGYAHKIPETAHTCKVLQAARGDAIPVSNESLSSKCLGTWIWCIVPVHATLAPQSSTAHSQSKFCRHPANLGETRLQQSCYGIRLQSQAAHAQARKQSNTGQLCLLSES